MDICRICLAIDIKVYKLCNNEAKSFIENIFMQNGFNQDLNETHYICFECKALLDKSYKFIKRVLKAQDILYNMLKDRKKITPESFKKIDRRVTGFNLVKDFKNIDLFIREEDTHNTDNNIVKNYQDNVKTIHPEEQLENADNDVKAFDLDTLKTDNLETSSELDVKDFICKDSKEEILDVSFEDFDFKLEETTLTEEDDVEILEEKGDKTVKKTKKKQEKKAMKNSILPKKYLVSTRVLNKKRNKQNFKEKKHRRRYILPSNEDHEDLFEYDGTEDLNGPQQLMAPDYPVKCDHCSYEVPDRMAHFRHYQWEHQDKKYPYGGKTGKIFICKFCGYASRNKSLHIDHERTHSDVHDFTCPECPKTFLNRAKMHKHIYRTHPAQMLECDYCGKKVKSRGSIMIHMRIHTGERPFKCPICGAGFAHRGNIRPHIRTNHNH